MDAKDEKHIDMRIAALDQTFKEGLAHQSEIMTMQVRHLSKAVEDSRKLAHEARAELREATRYWQQRLLGGIGILLATMVILATLLGGFAWNLKTEVVNEMTSIRKDIQRELAAIREDFQRETTTIRKNLQWEEGAIRKDLQLHTQEIQKPTEK